MVIRVKAGDFDSAGRIASASLTTDGPTWPGFQSSNSAREISLSDSLAKPLEITFGGEPTPAESIPVIWRKDPDVGWYPIAVGDPGGEAVSRRSQFSPHESGFVDVKAWAAGLGRWATGRTTPPTCGAAPGWVDMTEPTADILLACAGPASAGRAEVKVKNNRLTVREITIPAGVAYADAEGQPETVRKLVRSLADKRDVVLLPQGDELRVGLARPAEARNIEMAPKVSAFALGSELVVQVMDLAGERGSMAVLPALINVADCGGLETELVSGGLPDSPTNLWDLAADVSGCVKELADPVKAVVVAQNVVAATSGVPLDVVQSDRAFSAKVDAFAGRFNLAGKLAKAVKVADLARLAYALWESVGEELGRATVDVDPATVRIALSPRPTDVTRGVLQSAEVPAACTMPRQRLKNNRTTKTTKDYPNAGGQLSSADPGPRFADVAGLGYRQAVSFYSCGAGGVGWPPLVVLTGQGGKLLGHVDLADLTTRAHGDRGLVRDLAVNQKRVTARWSSTSGCCGALAEHRTVLAWQRSRLVVESETITKWSADGVASDIGAAAVAGDRNRLSDPAAVPSDVWRTLLTAADGADSSFISASIDGGSSRGGAEQLELSFTLKSGSSTTWYVQMVRAGNRYGWRMASVLPQ